MNVERLDRNQSFAMLAVLAGVLLPHAGRLPWWLLAALLVLFGWRAWLVKVQGRMPPRWVLLPITFLLVAGVFVYYRTLLGRTGGVAVLAALIGAKLLETRSRRDALLLIYLSYFLVVTNFLFDQTVGMALYLSLMVLLITTLLVGWHTLEGWTGRWRLVLGQMRFAGVLMLQALPVMALLFVFFPRMEGPLWRLPQDRGAARSGLADSMSPGSFSSMSRNDEVAFRVVFDGARPAQESLYWRGPVFDDYDGRTWSQAPASGETAPKIEPIGNAVVRYAITLEPHYRPWLLALDLPAVAPQEGRLTDRAQLIARRTVDKRLRLDLTALAQYRLAKVERPDLIARALALPPGGNPRARAVAAEWRTLLPAERVNAALRFFGSQRLQYTLTPPLYGNNAVDDFVFNGRQGFCEHFAGSFAFMLRAAGVPARVVGGYQGGDSNGDYLIVRQADAHAWTEVWLEGEGWRRVDPTFEVAPARIQEGLASAVPEEELPYLLRLDGNLVKRVRLLLDSAVNGWNQWVVGYTPERQRQLLAELGIDNLASGRFVAWFFGGLLVLIAVPASWLLWRMRPPKLDPAQRAWQQLCRKLARRGLQPGAAEGPKDFISRAIATLPEQAAPLEAILAAYLAVRYGSESRQIELQSLIRQFGR
ncbi:transglutaminase TgpA family protein [Chitinimonas naiadis]